MKFIGGDLWCVLFCGLVMVLFIIFDYGNGIYEFLFLFMDLGVYKLDIILDYSLCDGYCDLLKNWFIVGK